MLTQAARQTVVTRAAIRQPLGSNARVSVAVVDLDGRVLGFFQNDDAPNFGIDVSVQKARGALLFSHPDAAALLAQAPPADYIAPPGTGASIVAYREAFHAFLGDAGALQGAVAFSTRALGNLHRPMFPDGIEATAHGPLSKPMSSWSPLNVGFQLDLVFNQLVKGVGGDQEAGCAGRAATAMPGRADTGIALAANGIQIFPGGVPIYRNGQLAGAIGVSGDGVDQDDMIAFLGLANAGAVLANGVGNAPAAMRSDAVSPMGTRLRYVQCPQAPFNDASEQNACAGR